MSEDGEVIHPSAIIWPIPYGTKFPHQQAVKCAYCGKTGVRIAENRVKAKSLYYCDRDCKLARRHAVLAGKIPQVNSLPKPEPIGERSGGEWGDLKLGPRRNIKEMQRPTKYDKLYGGIN